MSKKEEYQGPIINSLQGELKPVDYSFIEKLTKKAGVSQEYLKKCEEIHRKKSKEELLMSKKEEYQGPIINSLQGELKPVDYSFIEDLRKKAGVSQEYLKKCEEIHRKKSMENQEKK